MLLSMSDTVFELSTKLLSKVGNYNAYIEPSCAKDLMDIRDLTSDPEDP